MRTTKRTLKSVPDSLAQITKELSYRSGIIVETHLLPVSEVTGLPVILVPGLGLSAKYLLPLAICISGMCDVWILEVKRAPAPASGKTLDAREAGRLITKWMEMRGMESAVLGGHSFGAQIVVEAVIHDCSRVREIVLIAPTVDASARTLVAQAWRLLRDAVREPFAAVRLAVTDYLRHPRNVFRMARAALAEDIRPRLAAVRCPATVVCGSRDPVVPRGWARTAAALLPQGLMVTINGAAHALPRTHWQEVAAEIKACSRSPALTCPH